MNDTVNERQGLEGGEPGSTPGKDKAQVQALRRYQ